MCLIVNQCRRIAHATENMRRPQNKLKNGAGGASKMADLRGKMKARMELTARTKRLGTPDPLDDTGDEPFASDPPATLGEINGAIKAIDKAKPKPKNKLSGEELEKWKANRARVKEIRERQADAEYYTVLVFDTRGQCQAFVDALIARMAIPRHGDLFIDGRHLASHLGIDLPAPEYGMTTSVALSQGRTKTMQKVPKGGVA